MEKGTYVLATQYSDDDPGDQWCVGFYDCEKGRRHYIVGKQEAREQSFDAMPNMPYYV